MYLNIDPNFTVVFEDFFQKSLGRPNAAVLAFEKVR